MVEGVLMGNGTYQVLKDTDGGICYLFACREEEMSLSCGRIPVSDKKVLTVGSDYRNDIFYECFSFMNDKKYLLYKEGEQLVLQICSSADNHRKEWVYLNEKAEKVAKGTVYLKKGDVVDIYGLGILVLKDFIVCYSHFGTLRIAQRKVRIPVSDTNRVGKGISKAPLKKRIAIKESVPCEELELEKKKEVPKKEEIPLFLTIGPMFAMILPTLMMFFIGRVLSGQNTGNFYISSLVMTSTSACFSVFFSLANRNYQKKRNQRLSVKAEQEYLSYLRKVAEYLRNRHQNIREHLLQCHPAATEIVREGVLFWDGEEVSKGQKLIRIGTGKRTSPITCKISDHKQFLEPAVWEKKRLDLKKEFSDLEEVPVGIYPMAGECTCFVGEGVLSLMRQFVIQAVSFYGLKQLRVVCFFREEDRAQRQFSYSLKWLPHIWQEDGKRRFLAGNEQEAANLLPYLTKQLQERRGGSEGLFYLVIVADLLLLKGEALLQELISGQKDLYCHTLFLAEKEEELAGFTGQLITAKRGNAEVRIVGKESAEAQNIRTEFLEEEAADYYMRRLYCLQKEQGESVSVPEEVDFLRLYDVKRVEELHCFSRWKEREEMKRIRVPIGIGEKGKLVYLDVHEKFHGPHGLIAGTTGAGKSELLQTYLLSLAVSFSPESVNFFIIDYKGGGMGQVLCELPHCSGVISNLSGSRIKRALLSLKSEAVRRQVLFGEEGVSHVDEYGKLYREGKVEEPIPHLILVVDEFAELKKEEPEFMQEVISFSQIGRSLGIHLLLATQKPAGTIDDKIWSNTRFRLCLRVADRQDSMDMLKRPEAAALTGAGRCYLQVGNNEIFEVFQSGYSSAVYKADEKKQTAYLVERTGERYKAKSEDRGTVVRQLEEVVNYVNETARNAGFQKARNLWMEELPEELYLAEIASGEKEKRGYIVGKYDDPYRQRQELLFYHPMSEGHLCLCGMPGSGKTTFLQTLLWQICQNPPAEAGFLLIGAKDVKLSGFLEMPHCMGYISKKEDAECFFYHLEKLVKKRKELLSDLTYLEQLKQGKKQQKQIFLLIDNYGDFREMTEDFYDSKIERIAKEGPALGICLVLTALGVGGGELSSKLFENVKKTLSLAMGDPMRYPEVLRQFRIQTIPSEGVPGRGLCVENGEVLQMQIPLISCKDEVERIQKISQYTDICKQRIKEKMSGWEEPERFLRLPEKTDWNQLSEVWEKRHRHEEQKQQTTQKQRIGDLPIGYLLNSGNIQTISLHKHFPLLISGEEGCGKTEVMDYIVECFKVAGIPGIVFRTDEKKQEDNWMQYRFLAIYDLPGFVHMAEQMKRSGKKEGSRLEEQVRKKELLLLAIHRPGQEAELLGTFWYEVFSTARGALHIGGNVASQRLFSFDDIPYSMQNKREKRGVAYFKEGPGGRTKRLLIPVKEEECADDYD